MNYEGQICRGPMFLHGQAPLYQDITKENFTPADELENLMEERRLLELLEIEYLKYEGFHDFIEFRVKDTLPKDRETMLLKLDKEIEKYSNQNEQMVAIVD